MREMKDCGIEWVGKIPSDWKIERLQWHLEEKNVGNNPIQTTNILSLTNKKGVIPYEEKGNQGNKSKEDVSGYKLAYPNTIVANSMNVIIGSVGLSKYYGCVSPVYYVFQATNRSNIEFFNYVFSVVGFQRELRKYANGILEIRLRVSADNILKRPVMIPPDKEQLQIVNFLNAKCSEIDAISADIRKEIETLEQYKRSVITEAVTKGLKPDVKMKDSGVAWCPRIPSHWQYTNPKGLFGLRIDRAFRGDRQLTASQEYGIVYQDEYMEVTGNQVVTVTKDFSILKHVEPDDFVISMRSFQGGLEYSDKRGCISSAYVMLIPNKEFVYAPFYRWFFKSSKYINALQSTSNLVRDGQAMRYANFVKVPLFIIPIEEQKAIASYLDEKIEKVSSILAAKKKQLEILSNYKKSIIYEYVTGKKEAPAQN